MNSRNFWRFALVVFVVAWAINEMTPPTSRDLIEVFQERASNTDSNFTAIVKQAQQAQKLQGDTPGRQFTHLREAIGNKVITNYFSFIDVKAEKDPNFTKADDRGSRESHRELRIRR